MRLFTKTNNLAIMKNVVTLIFSCLVFALSAQTVQKKQFKELLANNAYDEAYEMLDKGFNAGEQSIETLKQLSFLAEKTRNYSKMLKVSEILLDKATDKKYPGRSIGYIEALKSTKNYLDAQNFLDRRLKSSDDNDSIVIYSKYYEGVLLGLSKKDPSVSIKRVRAPFENEESIESISTNPNGEIFYLTSDGQYKRRNYIDTIWSTAQSRYTFSLPKTKKITNLSFDENSKNVTYAIETSLGKEVVESKLYSSSFSKDTTWSMPVVQEAAKEWGVNIYQPHITIFKGLETLFFSSDMKGGFGGKDIYYATITDAGELSIPENAGSNVNSDDDEMHPFLFGDRLYFSSNNPRSIGGLDIFFASFDQAFKRSENAGKGINSNSDDFSYKWIPSLKKGVLISNRKGNDEIYEVNYVPKPSLEIVPVLPEGESSSGIQFEVVDEENKELNAHSLLKTNVFWLELDRNYTIWVTKPGFYADSVALSTRGMKPYERTIVKIPFSKILAQGNVDPNQFVSTQEKWLEGETTLSFSENSADLNDAIKSEIDLVAKYLQEKPAVNLELLAYVNDNQDIVYRRIAALQVELETSKGLPADRVDKVDLRTAEAGQEDKILVRMVRAVSDEDIAMPVMAEDEITKLEFDAEEHHFGSIKEGVKVSHTFTFKNTGNYPFVIEYASGSCGCTVPSFPRSAIPVGETGTITVTFDSTNKSGLEETSVTIIGNIEEQVVDLKIKALVE